MIPNTFEEWRDCIVNDCKIKLTKDFAKKRLAVYENPNHPETRKFQQLYGAQHLYHIILWLRRV
ncbi:MAG: hypothetical protein AAF960_07330 [Bacteroidota bacterium]